VGACSLFYEVVQDALDAGDLIDLGIEFPELSRWALRRPNALNLEHLRLVAAVHLERDGFTERELGAAVQADELAAVELEAVVQPHRRVESVRGGRARGARR